MTCNQLIVLMDVRRGFREEGHTGTLNDDIEELKACGLVRDSHDDGFPYGLTDDGREFCDRVLKRAGELVVLARYARKWPKGRS